MGCESSPIQNNVALILWFKFSLISNKKKKKKKLYVFIRTQYLLGPVFIRTQYLWGHVYLYWDIYIGARLLGHVFIGTRIYLGHLFF